MGSHPDLGASELQVIARRIISNVEVTYSGAPFLEIPAAGIHKAETLAWLCTQYHHGSSEVIAFGDIPHDSNMLFWAGHSVTVVNAHPEGLAIADENTEASIADGVALVLERLLTPADNRPPRLQHPCSGRRRRPSHGPFHDGDA